MIIVYSRLTQTKERTCNDLALLFMMSHHRHKLQTKGLPFIFVLTYSRSQSSQQLESQVHNHKTTASSLQQDEELKEIIKLFLPSIMSCLRSVKMVISLHFFHRKKDYAVHLL